MIRKLKTIEMRRLSVEQYRTADKTPLVVVLDDVRSMHNVGSVFRTADAFRLERVCLCGITATPPHNDIHKTALGAEESVPWTYYKDAAQCVAALRAEGYRVFAIEQCEGSTMLGDVSLTPTPPFGGQGGLRGYAVVLGNEVHGVQQRVIDATDGCIEIPQYGTKHSLNVSVTAGIVIYSLFSSLRL